MGTVELDLSKYGLSGSERMREMMQTPSKAPDTPTSEADG